MSMVATHSSDYAHHCPSRHSSAQVLQRLALEGLCLAREQVSADLSLRLVCLCRHSVDGRCTILSLACLDLVCMVCVHKNFQRISDMEPRENWTLGRSRSRSLSPPVKWLYEDAREDHYIDEDASQFDAFTDSVVWRVQLQT